MEGEDRGSRIEDGGWRMEDGFGVARQTWCAGLTGDATPLPPLMKGGNFARCYEVFDAAEARPLPIQHTTSTLHSPPIHPRLLRPPPITHPPSTHLSSILHPPSSAIRN